MSLARKHCFYSALGERKTPYGEKLFKGSILHTKLKDFMFCLNVSLNQQIFTL